MRAVVILAYGEKIVTALQEARVLVPVVLCGGAGSRLWPSSRADHPKHLLELVPPGTLLQQTVSRLEGLDDLSEPVVVCGEHHHERTVEQLEASGVRCASRIVEPMRRNTAAAIALAALEMVRSAPEALLLVLPADHVIRDAQGFRAAVERATAPAREGSLVTFGVVPTHPETGYGYLETRGTDSVRELIRFIEKPSREVAEELVARGTFLWNAGMFCFRADRFLEELAAHEPDVLRACTRAMEMAHRAEGVVRPGASAFAASPSISIDYAVMERTRRGAAVPLDVGWSDIGSWRALRDALAAPDENAVFGDVVVRDSEGCLLRSEHRLLAAIGLRDLLVVETADAVLVSPIDSADALKRLVGSLEGAGRVEVTEPVRGQAPWGRYEVVARGEGYRVRRLVVAPLGRVALHRGAQCLVVAGAGTLDGVAVTVGTTVSVEEPVVLVNTASEALEILETRWSVPLSPE